MTYLRPPLKSQAQTHGFWYPTCHCRPKINQTGYFQGFRVLFLFGSNDLYVATIEISNSSKYFLQHVTVGPKLAKLVNFRGFKGFGFFLLGSNDLSEATNEIPSSRTCFWYPTCHCRPKIGQNHGFGYIFGFGLGWLVLDWFQWRIWGCHGISQLKHMLFGTEHVTVGQKMAKTMILAIFLALAWLGLVLVIILVHCKDGSNDTSKSSIWLKTPNISRDIYSGVRILF